MLRKGREQIRSHLDSLPGSNRSAVLVVAGLLLASGLFYITRGKAVDSSEPLFGGRHLRQIEMDQVELAFSAAGLSEWDRNGNQMLIPRQDRHQYIAALQNASALPYTLRSSMEKTLEDASYFESDSARKRRHDFAKAQDLGAKIAAFGDIAWASVDYDEQPGHGFDATPIRSASVVLMPEDGIPMDPARIRMIQEFVRGAYAGMSAENVVVTDTLAGETYGLSSDPSDRHRQQIEHELEAKVAKLLGSYDGITVVASSVTPSSIAPGDQTIKDDRDSLRLSIGIPERHVHAQWRTDRVNAGVVGELLAIAMPSTTELEQARETVFRNVRTAVESLLPHNTDPESLQLCSLPDTQYIDVNQAATIPASQPWNGSLRQQMLYIVPIGCLVLVGLGFGLAALRLRLKSSSADPQTIPMTAHATSPNASEFATEQFASVQSESTMRDELADLIDSNPELAAQIVHGWLAEAA